MKTEEEEGKKEIKEEKKGERDDADKDKDKEEKEEKEGGKKDGEEAEGGKKEGGEGEGEGAEMHGPYEGFQMAEWAALVRAPICLRTPYPMPGTDVPYSGPLLTPGTNVPLSASCLRDAGTNKLSPYARGSRSLVLT